MHWYETDTRTPEQKRLAQRAYYRVLLASREGRDVLCDMRRRVAEKRHLAAASNELALAQLWLEYFLADTVALCGADDPTRLARAEESIARDYVPEQAGPELPEGYAE